MGRRIRILGEGRDRGAADRRVVVAGVAPQRADIGGRGMASQRGERVRPRPEHGAPTRAHRATPRARPVRSTRRARRPPSPRPRRRRRRAPPRAARPRREPCRPCRACPTSARPRPPHLHTRAPVPTSSSSSPSCVSRNRHGRQLRRSRVGYNHAVDPAVLPILACPRCRAVAPFADLRTPRCKVCGLEPRHDQRARPARHRRGRADWRRPPSSGS